MWSRKIFMFLPSTSKPTGHNHRSFCHSMTYDMWNWYNVVK
jgi:hypothetical protein